MILPSGMLSKGQWKRKDRWRSRAGRSTRRNIFVALVCKQLIVALQKFYLALIARQYEHVKNKLEKVRKSKDCNDCDSAEKPPIHENSGWRKWLTKLRSCDIEHLCAKYFFLIFGKRLFQQNRLLCLTPLTLLTLITWTCREAPRPMTANGTGHNGIVSLKPWRGT